MVTSEAKRGSVCGARTLESRRPRSGHHHMTPEIERDHDLARFHFPGARRPDRHRWVDSHGLRIHVCEWGKAGDPVLFLLHGAMDFAGTFDVFAPMLASAGWRVVSWDHRGHGDSDYAELYSWDGDLRDAVAVMDATTMIRAPSSVTPRADC